MDLVLAAAVALEPQCAEACPPLAIKTPAQVALLIAGAKERGELENRVTKLLAETKEAGDVVLMWVAECDLGWSDPM